jgi:hypothetical protein
MKIKYIFGALIALFGFLLLKDNSSSLMGYLFLAVGAIVLLKDIFKGNITIVDDISIDHDSSSSFFDSSDSGDGGGGD